MKGMGTSGCSIACIRNKIEKAREKKVHMAYGLILAGLGLLALAYNGALEEFRLALQTISAAFSLSGFGAAVRFNLPW